MPKTKYFEDGLEVKYLKRLSWFGFWGLIVGTAIMGMFIGLLAGGLKTTTVMNSMKSGMDDMNRQMTQGTRAVATVAEHLKGKFPSNQPEVTVRQMLGIVENSHKISARAQYLLDHIEPEAIGQTVMNVNKILGAVTPEQVDLAKTHLLNIVGHLDRIVAGVEPEKIAQLINTFGGLDAVQINALVAMVSKLHEIKIQL